LLYAALTFQPVWVVAAPFGAEPELRRNYVALENRIAGRKPHDLSYREFVAASVFDQVRARMGQEASRRVVSVGLHPAVAALNGFSCADGYHDNYPLAYKDRFRRLIGGELRYDESLRRYFDEWGSRAYVFLRGKTMPAYGIRQGKYRILGRLALDESALHDLGIRWVVSALLIADPADERFLDYEGRFDDPGSAYAIHLYRVRD
jgi:hypothetical protein